MTDKLTKDRRAFEIMLILVAVGMTILLYRMGAYKMVVLNLFYLPIVLSGFYLGRNSAGVLALFCAISVMIATTVDAAGFASFDSPVMVGLALTIWAAVLGLTAILVGTLCDERAAKVEELHEAYVGVVNVLSTYLQSADPKVRARSIRVAELSQSVAREMKLPQRQIDDIRVAALLHDLGNVEITTKLLTKAVDTLEANGSKAEKHTFLGADLVHSLGAVLHGAVPLLVNQDEAVREILAAEEGSGGGEIPLGAKIIQAVRTYYALTARDYGQPPRPLSEVLKELRADPSGDYDQAVVTAIERVIARTNKVKPLEPALA
jgi:HD-GYP domain-containing protein (c-di-GMP phosphodiesterase class II)